MDRVARRLAAGAAIAEAPADYVLGVARAIVREESGAEKPAEVDAPLARSASPEESGDRSGRRPLKPAEVDAPLARSASPEESGDRSGRRPSGRARELGEAEEPARVEALEACLLVLGDEDRAVFAQYQARVEARAKLASELGVSLPMLREKASRIRARVERCMSARLARGHD